jgi:phenylalanyl-tRNA synthetase beta chain
MLGAKVPVFEAVQYLALDGLTVKKKNEILEVIVPTRRPDLRDEWNLIEEIGRLRGYDKVIAVPPRLPLGALPENAAKRFERKAKELLTGLGYSEMMTYGFCGERDVELFHLPPAEHLTLANPMSPEQQYLRMSLLPSMATKTRDNLRHTTPVRLFEWESVFRRDKKTEVAEEKRLALSFAATGASGPQSFFALKGSLTAFFRGLGLPDCEYQPALATDSLWHRTQSADIVVSGERIGTIGTIDPLIGKELGLPAGAAFADLTVSALARSAGHDHAFALLPKYPYVERDISLVFPADGKRKVTIAAVEKLIREAGAPLLKEVELFDVFEREGRKNVAFHLKFGAEERTLSSDEADVLFKSIVMEIDKHLGGALHL